MPELPEVECIRRSLVKSLIGARIEHATLRRADILLSPKRVARAAALLTGRQIVELKRKGKQLALCTEADGPVLVVQLGMTGQLFITPATRRISLQPHTHATWQFRSPDSEGQLHFRDPRRFGRLVALPTPDDLAERWSYLGPDAVSITAKQLAAALHSARGPRITPIKSLLLNQGLIAGVGNIYADEALFLAGIAPTRAAGDLDAREVQSLSTAIRKVMRQAIQSGGSTIRDFVDGSGAAGSYQQRHLAYGRAGAPCLRCGHMLAGATIAQRSTVWCPACQPDASVGSYKFKR